MMGFLAISVSFAAASAAPEQSGAVREAAATFMIVSLLLLAMFTIIAIVMMTRRRRVALANRRADLREKKSADLPDAWASAGERARPFDSRDVD